jgi:hypothetical protein
MTSYDLTNLLRTVERIRASDFPSLSPTFLEQVVRAEERNPDDQDALRAIQAALRTVLGDLDVS